MKHVKKVSVKAARLEDIENYWNPFIVPAKKQ